MRSEEQEKVFKQHVRDIGKLRELTVARMERTDRRIAATQGRFSGIRRVAPVCTPQYLLTWAQPSPNPKRHLDRFSRFCTAHGSESLHFTTGRPFALLKLPLPLGYLDPMSKTIDGSLGPPEATTQTASRFVQKFFARLTLFRRYGDVF